MPFDVTYPGALKGRFRVPGDLDTTLILLAFGMISSGSLKVVNPSQSPKVVALRKYFEECCAEFHDTPEGFEFTGRMWDGDITIDPHIPDRIVHMLIAATVFSGQSASLLGDSPQRTSIVSHLLRTMKQFGYSDDHLVMSDKAVKFLPAELVLPESAVTVHSAWELETICAALSAKLDSLIVTYPQHVVASSVRVMKLLGCRFESPEAVDDRDTELVRRMAKAAGEIPPETRRIEWTDIPGEEVTIPGDMFIASAVLGAAAVLPKSEVTVESVLWEQGRKGFIDALRRMKADITVTKKSAKNSFDIADVTIKYRALEGAIFSTVHSHAMIAELPILGAVASCALGETIISDVVASPGFGRESFNLLARGLEKLGTHVGDYADGIILEGGQDLHGAEVQAGGYASIAAALTIAGLTSTGTTTVSDVDGDVYPVDIIRKAVRELQVDLAL